MRYSLDAAEPSSGGRQQAPRWRAALYAVVGWARLELHPDNRSAAMHATDRSTASQRLSLSVKHHKLQCLTLGMWVASTRQSLQQFYAATFARFCARFSARFMFFFWALVSAGPSPLACCWGC